MLPGLCSGLPHLGKLLEGVPNSVLQCGNEYLIQWRATLAHEFNHFHAQGMSTGARSNVDEPQWFQQKWLAVRLTPVCRVWTILAVSLPGNMNGIASRTGPPLSGKLCCCLMNFAFINYHHMMCNTMRLIGWLWPVLNISICHIYPLCLWNRHGKITAVNMCGRKSFMCNNTAAFFMRSFGVFNPSARSISSCSFSWKMRNKNTHLHFCYLINEFGITPLRRSSISFLCNDISVERSLFPSSITAIRIPQSLLE